VPQRNTQLSPVKERLVSFRLGKNDKQTLDRLAGMMSVSVSDLIRLCIKSELPKLKKKYRG